MFFALMIFRKCEVLIYEKEKFLFIVAMVFILMLSGCGKSSTSEPITTTKFKTIMEEKGWKLQIKQIVQKTILIKKYMLP